jgi:hypothetical protein
VGIASTICVTGSGLAIFLLIGEQRCPDIFELRHDEIGGFDLRDSGY